MTIALSILESTKKTGVGRSTLYTAMNSGRLTYLKIGRRRLLREADLVSWLDRHAVGAALADVADTGLGSPVR